MSLTRVGQGRADYAEAHRDTDPRPSRFRDHEVYRRWAERADDWAATIIRREATLDALPAGSIVESRAGVRYEKRADRRGLWIRTPEGISSMWPARSASLMLSPGSTTQPIRLVSTLEA